MPNPFANTQATRLIIDRVRDLAHRKTQAEIAAETGFVNANFVSLLKSGKNKIPLDRVPALAKALEVDPALLMRLALDQAVGVTASQAIVEIFGSPVTENERGWLTELREASDNTDPRLPTRSRVALRGIFGNRGVDRRHLMHQQIAVHRGIRHARIGGGVTGQHDRTPGVVDAVVPRDVEGSVPDVV